MADFNKLIAEKDKSARYMIDEITHICSDFEKRDPGSKGEKDACEYMAGVLKNQCGCEKADVEPFKLNPGSFYGWIYITFSLMFAALICYFFVPIISAVLIAFGWLIAILQFGLYFKFVDKLFPEKTSHNVTAVKKCSGEVKRRIFFNGHPDAAYEWPMNYKFGGVGFEGHAIVSAVGAVYYLVLSIVAAANGNIAGVFADGPLFWCAIGGMIFVIPWFGMFFMWNPKRVVDGANDNLSGCYMGIALLKALYDNKIDLKHTEVGVILTGSEEAGLRGTKAWCEQHKDEYKDVETLIFSYDTIHDPKFLMVNYRDLNGTVAADKEASDLFYQCAQELGIHCSKGMVPPLGGATDSAGFAQGGFRSAGITGLNHNLENYYHTRRDAADNMNAQGLADCYAVTVKVLETFDAKND